MRPFVSAALCWLLPLCLQAQTPVLKLKQIATGLVAAVDIANCGDSRLFVVRKHGVIHVFDSTGKMNQLPFLNIQPRVRESFEQGLLGLAFHPNYAQNGWFFVHYSVNPDSSGQISRFTVSATNPNRADPDSELKILNIKQPAENHNGGCIKFGPDGMLYIGMGDGGWGGDPLNSGQRPDALLGKMLRIDVDSSTAAQPYKIPPDNPFVGVQGYRPEIWSLGWRNPWRFSFDRLNGDMWIGDVGQDREEEVNREPAGAGGRNYGWRCYEGLSSYNTSSCNATDRFIKPVFAFDHTTANPFGAVIGGFVYRGLKNPDLYGKYIFTDNASGRWWLTQVEPNGQHSTVQIADLDDNEYSSLGEDSKGELYVVAVNSGRLYRLSYAPVVATDAPADVLGCNIGPNPAQDVFDVNLVLRRARVVHATLFNANGQALASQSGEGDSLQLRFDLGARARGVYYLRIQTAGGNMVRPVVKW